MKTNLPATVLLLALAVGMAPAASIAQARQAAPAQQQQAQQQLAQPQQPNIRIAPAARDAVVVVNDFMQALITGNLPAARQLLDPGVTVISNGRILGTRDEYMARQAPTDSAFLGKAQRQLLRRDGRAGPQFAWVVSEKAYRTDVPGKPPVLMVTAETMVLAKAPAGWRIVHIHWSSRPVAPR